MMSYESPIDIIMKSTTEKMEHDVPPEHSKESIKRRCVQIRQELLMVMKEL